MPVYRLKPAFQALLRPLARRLWRAGVTADQVTVAAALGSVGLGAGLWLATPAHPGVWWAVPPWMLARMALNAIDGLLAREFDAPTARGAYLNELGDVVGDAALWLPLARVAPFAPEPVVLGAIVAGWTELAGVLGATVGASRRYDGPLGKSDRALLLAALGAWIGTGRSLPPWTAAVPWVALALLGATVANRVGQGLLERRTR